ncbi:MAG: hypothetical protein ABI587_15970 [Gemmatimonadales bacterium]
MNRVLRILWPLPVTLLGAAGAGVARLFGARVALHDGVLEASGGPLGMVLHRMYPPMSVSAITLGHVVLAQDEACLTRTRAHERVHVRQYERWGFLFPLVYVAASGVALLQGREGYRGNWFEREAEGVEAASSPLLTTAVPDSAGP